MPGPEQHVRITRPFIEPGGKGRGIIVIGDGQGNILQAMFILQAGDRQLDEHRDGTLVTGKIKPEKETVGQDIYKDDHADNQ